MRIRWRRFWLRVDNRGLRAKFFTLALVWHKIRLMSAADFIHTTFSKNPFAMFAPQPVGVHFENQESGEKIILLLRAHIVTLVPSVLLILLFIFLPFLAPSFLGIFRLQALSVFDPRQLILIFIFWYLNVYLITNERVIDIDFRGILHKETSYAKLNQIQDISPKIIGFFGTFFHYGNIYIQTAAERPEFEFHNVENPNMVAQEIHEQVRKEESEPPGVIA